MSFLGMSPRGSTPKPKDNLNLKVCKFKVMIKTQKVSRRTLGISMCMREVLKFLKSEKIIELQLVDQRRFYKLATVLIKHLCIFRRSGIRVNRHTIEILRKTEN